MHRRGFLSFAVGTAALDMLPTSPFMRLAQAATRSAEIRAVAFDAFPVFDPRPILRVAQSVAPADEDFGAAWFSKIFACTWLRTSGGQYRDFPAAIGESLDYTASTRGILATAGLGLEKEEIAFCAFAAWDAAGASWFGYPTVWVNRAGQAAEELDVSPTAVGGDLSVLLDFLDDRVAG